MNAYLEKLKYDLIKGSRIAFKATENVLDSQGSCNFDCVRIFLKHYKKEVIISLVEEIGLGCFKNNADGCYHISPHKRWQGAKNTVFSESLFDYLTKEGHSVGMYYKLD